MMGLDKLRETEVVMIIWVKCMVRPVSSPDTPPRRTPESNLEHPALHPSLLEMITNQDE